MDVNKWMSGPARLSAAALIATLALGGGADAHSPQGQGMMGQGTMAQGPVGQGQMGQGMMGTAPQQGDGQATMPGQGQTSPMGPGMMGQGQMGPGAMGMMGQGRMMPGGMMGPQGMGMMGMGMMGPHGMQGGFYAGFEKDYSAEDLKRIVDGRLAWRGLSRLRAGEAKEVDKDTIEVKIVTKEGSVAAVLKIDRKTARVKSIE